MPRRALIGYDELPAGWLKSAADPLLTLPATIIRSYRYATGSLSVRLVGPRTVFGASKPDEVFLVTQKHHRPGWIFLPGPGHLEAHLSRGLHKWVAESWTKALQDVCRDRENKPLPIPENGNGEVPVRIGSVAAEALSIRSSFEVLANLLRGSASPHSLPPRE